MNRVHRGHKQSTAEDVTTYVEEVSAGRREALARLRERCRTSFTDFEETLDYDEASYKRNGEVEVGFASQQPFIDLYMLRLRTDMMKAHRDRLKGKGICVGKGAIRYLRPEQIDFDVVESMLRVTQGSVGPVC
jgi:uncharacterized protein YdhG (YjbR/CyaY superfamily)